MDMICGNCIFHVYGSKGVKICNNKESNNKFTYIPITGFCSEHELTIAKEINIENKYKKMWEELKENFETLLSLGNREGYNGLSKMNQLEKENK